MSLPYSSSTPADDPMKKEECHKAAAAVRNMLEKVLLHSANLFPCMAVVCCVDFFPTFVSYTLLRIFRI